MNNYKTLSILKLLKSTIDLFINSFFVMYFLEISNNNIPKLGIYYILVYLTVYITIYLCKNICKTDKRKNLLRIGIILNFIYFLLILILKEKLVTYIYIMAIIYGLEEGFYYSVFNNYESTSISNIERAKFNGIYTCLKSMISIIFPLIFGSIINENSFKECTILVLIIVIIQIIFSVIFKDNEKKENKKTNIKEFQKIKNNDNIIKNLYTTCLFNGFIFTGAFKSLVTIYIIKIFNTSLNLGIFTSIFAIITSILGVLFAKVIKKNNHIKIINISTIILIIGIVLLIFKVDFITVVIFNFLQTISSTLYNLILNNIQLDVSNHKLIKEKYKVEYFVEMEKYLFIGRTLGYIIYIIFGITNIIIVNNLILLIFAFLIITLGYNCNKLIRTIIKSDRVDY